MKTYEVTAKRWEHGWELHIAGVGVTQARSLALAERQVKDYIETLEGVDRSKIKVTLRPELPPDIQKEVAETRRAVRKAAEMQRETAQSSRKVARDLQRQKFSGADIAAVLEISPQRVSQLLNSK